MILSRVRNNETKKRPRIRFVHKTTTISNAILPFESLFKYIDKFDGETTLTIPHIKFTLHDINGLKIEKNDFELRVLFGRNPKPRQIPWQIQIVNHYRELRCGGTLVTSNKIVSAAHCFHESRAQFNWRSENLVARAGTLKQYGGGSHLQEQKCSDIIIHS